jgi:hypothetical protein
MENDLFGNEIIKDILLRDRFIEPPFSVLDTKTENWQKRKRLWKSKNIKSEIGRNESLTYTGNIKEFDYYRVKEGKKDESDCQGTSIFDPALCELIYKWFCPDNGYIIDPFAGGSVRGIVAGYLGYHYIGIELRKEQIEANIINAQEILNNNIPEYIQGDSEEILRGGQIIPEYDLLFSCPPYMNLEVYSNDPADLSNMNDKDFIIKYENIIKLSCDKLSNNGYSCFVVGDVRDKKTGFYKDFPGITKNAFKKAGWGLYNEMVLLNPVASASMRAGKVFESGKKVTKIHQNILIFRKEKAV